MAESTRLRLALAQIDPTVGDVEGNASLIAEWINRAREAGAGLVVFPELALTGYPPEDLLLRPSFLNATAAALEELARGVGEDGPIAIVGFPEVAQAVHNSAAVLA